MPTFTAIALDTLLEPGASKPVEKSIPRLVPKPLGDNLNRSLERRNSASLATDAKPKRPPLTPSLYTTPEATPLPGSPTSFPPSPYIVNHKRRGPRLLKSSCANHVAPRNIDARAIEEEEEEEEEEEKEKADSGHSGSSETKLAEPIEEPRLNGSNGEIESGDGNLRSLRSGWAGSSWSSVRVPSTPERDSDRDDFYDPRESMSFTSSTDVEDNAESERSAQVAAPSVEFYDAWEELSSDSGQQQSSYRDVEAELREMRLSFVMEIEKRKQAEEAFSNMQKQWQNVRRQLSLAGLTLPADPTELEDDDGDTLCRQVHLARFVANAIGRGLVRAELEAEMEKQVEAKNFEIARLCDKLRNYEAMNQEMVQRNQDVLETTRRERMRKERRQRWLWGSVAAALTLGAAGLAWTYRPSGTGSLSVTSHDFEAPETEDQAD